MSQKADEAGQATACSKLQPAGNLRSSQQQLCRQLPVLTRLPPAGCTPRCAAAVHVALHCTALHGHHAWPAYTVRGRPGLHPNSSNKDKFHAHAWGQGWAGVGYGSHGHPAAGACMEHPVSTPSPCTRRHVHARAYVPAFCARPLAPSWTSGVPRGAPPPWRQEPFRRAAASGGQGWEEPQRCSAALGHGRCGAAAAAKQVAQSGKHGQHAGTGGWHQRQPVLHAGPTSQAWTRAGVAAC